MANREVHPTGLEYLDLVTTLLQRARLASPDGGIWEAADLQWWYRRDQHLDPAGATVVTVDDEPDSAAIFTEWGDNWGLDLVNARHDSAAALDAVWEHGLERLAERTDRPVEMEIREDDAVLRDAALAGGFVATDDTHVSTTMAAADRPVPHPMPDGFELVAWGDGRRRAHPMVGRSGEHVADHLRACSLYRPDLDLAAIEIATGAVAGYGLFWADLVTCVGLVEPMRTEDAYQGRGIARSLLEHGVDRLARCGCVRIDVAYSAINDAARRLYLGSGFRAASLERTYRRA